ncbi:MAG TPA: glutamine-hydrolyzing carbamoyl-phosphate synthase small subunit [Nevskiaceae bacterium]|nr:glutamine-hydrolyzing carbamoyl-phosphate synthase small subunit [Nevskiaceae bacterium]
MKYTSPALFTHKPGALYLADGTVFTGNLPAWQKDVYAGEVVFNTGMTGYVESLTDPSYAEQLLVFTYPLIGNYGVHLKDVESQRIHLNGVIVSEVAVSPSHTQADMSLLTWLHSQSIPIITGLDTRKLTKHLRTQGTMQGYISGKPINMSDRAPMYSQTPSQGVIHHNSHHAKKVILVDCGAKGGILNHLLQLPVSVKQVPSDYDYTSEDYDGVILSNGPGDPAAYMPTVQIARKAFAQGKAMFGICLGNQIMGLAAGAQTYKLKYGHRGHNQPCIDTGNQRCYVTSQNHGYAIDETSLPEGWKVLFRNLNDDSVEGIECADKPFFAVQFHPEACPGPTDTTWLFKRFYQAL